MGVLKKVRRILEKIYNFNYIENFAMSVFSMFAIGFLIMKAGKSFLDGLFEQPKATNDISEPKKYNVKYYSEGLELSRPFHIEYKMIAKSMEGDWKYTEEFQELINNNPNAPILDVTHQNPINRSYSYSYNHIYLANCYLEAQKEYLGSLN